MAAARPRRVRRTRPRPSNRATSRRLRMLADLALVVGIIGAIVLLLAPGETPLVQLVEGPLRRVGHLAIFFALGIAAGVRYATSRTARRRPMATLLAYIVVLLSVAALLELAQGYATDRSPQVADGAANVIGAATGFVLSGPIIRRVLLR